MYTFRIDWHRLQKLVALLSLALVVAACGEQTQAESKDRVIEREAGVLDLVITESSAEPQPTGGRADVGFDADGYESRMLLFFPKMSNLYKSDVILASVTSVEIIVSAARVPVHPEAIKIYPLSSPWSTSATWSSRLSLASRSMPWLTPGGDFDPSQKGVTPALRRNDRNPDLKDLSFDITASVTAMVERGEPNYGFIIVIEKSDKSASNSMSIMTYNSSDKAARPIAALVFNTEDIFAP